MDDTTNGQSWRSQPSLAPESESAAGGTTRSQRALYRDLDRLGRIPLSSSFYMRDFLHSEIAAAYGIPNIPNNVDLAIETGTNLCRKLLEPLQKAFGPIRVRSGYRSAPLNAFGHQRNLSCAANEKNYAAHIWDRLDRQGRKGASACVAVPSLMKDDLSQEGVKTILDEWCRSQPELDHVRFFKQPATFNIGWKSECVGGHVTRNG